MAANPAVSGPLLVGVALLIGVGIDLDHFPLARLNRGDWTALRRCVRDPRIVVFDQDAIFDDGEVGAGRRLVSHLVVGGVLLVGLATVNTDLAWVGGAVLGIHIAMDVVHDVVTRAADAERLTNA